MGQKSRYQVGRKQRFKRRDARKKLAAKGEDTKEYYYGKYYLKSQVSGA